MAAAWSTDQPEATVHRIAHTLGVNELRGAPDALLGRGDPERCANSGATVVDTTGPGGRRGRQRRTPPVGPARHTKCRHANTITSRRGRRAGTRTRRPSMAWCSGFNQCGASSSRTSAPADALVLLLGGWQNGNSTTDGDPAGRPLRAENIAGGLLGSLAALPRRRRPRRHLRPSIIPPQRLRSSGRSMASRTRNILFIRRGCVERQTSSCRPVSDGGCGDCIDGCARPSCCPVWLPVATR